MAEIKIVKNRRLIIPISIIISVFIILSIWVPFFITRGNLMNILEQSSAIGLMAIGMSIVLIGGGIDLSVPPNMALSGILGAMYMRAGGSPWISVLIMLLSGITIGILNGYAVAYLKMIPFVVTLSMMYIVTGASVWLTRDVSISGVNMNYVDVVLSKPLGIPFPVVLLIFMGIIIAIIFKKSAYGRWIYAVGSDEKSAQFMGIPNKKVVLSTYISSGFFAGLAAIIMVGRLMSASATMGDLSVVLYLVGASVIGGMSIYGGKGSPIGAIIGAIVVTTINNVLNLLNVAYFYGLITTGLIIILIVAIDSYRRNNEG